MDAGSSQHVYAFYAFHRGVEIKADGAGNFFAVVHGCPLMRSSVKELRKLIDRKLEGR